MSSSSEYAQLKDLYKRREESPESYARYQYEMAMRFQKYLRREGYGLEELKVLDIGCAVGGESCGYMSQNPSLCIGVDVDVEALHTAVNFAARLDIHPFFVCADVFNLPFQDASFDMVISNGLVEHLPTINGLFPSIYRILRPGGCVRLSFASWKGPFAGHIRDQLPCPYIHLLYRPLVHWLIGHCRLPPYMTHERVRWKFDSCFSYTGRHVRRMAEKQGLKVIREEYVIQVHPIWAAFRMGIAKLLKIRQYDTGKVRRVMRECPILIWPFSFLFWILRHLFRISRVLREYAPDLYVLHLRRPDEEVEGFN